MARDSFIHLYSHGEPKQASGNETRLAQHVSVIQPYRSQGLRIPHKSKQSSVRPRNDGPNQRARLLTMENACEYLQCTRRYVERAVRSGRLRALKPTRRFVRFRQADLDAFLESGATIGAHP
jgi:excisionase family DNA binding protein